jgi:hypothetical protein
VPGAENIGPTPAPVLPTLEPTSTPVVGPEAPTPIVPSGANLIPEDPNADDGEGTFLADSSPLFSLEGLSQVKVDQVNALAINTLSARQVELFRALDLVNMPDEQVEDAFHTIRTAPEALQGLADLHFNQVANALQWTQNEGPHAGETFRWRWRMGTQVNAENGYLGVRVTGRVGVGLGTDVEFECDQYAKFCLNANEGFAQQFPDLANGMFESIFAHFRYNPNVNIRHVIIQVTGPGNQLGLEDQVVLDSPFSYKRMGDRLILSIDPAMMSETDLTGFSQEAMMALIFALDQEAAGLEEPRVNTTQVGDIGAGTILWESIDNVINALGDRSLAYFPYSTTAPLQPYPQNESLEAFNARYFS